MAHSNRVQEKNACAKVKSALIEGRSTTGAPIIVRHRADRKHPLVSLFGSGKQIIQIVVAPPVSPEVAAAIMVDIGSRFIDGSLAKCDLYKERNALLCKRGLLFRVKLKKRPAVARNAVGEGEHHDDMPSSHRAEPSAEQPLEATGATKPTMAKKEANTPGVSKGVSRISLDNIDGPCGSLDRGFMDGPGSGLDDTLADGCC